MIVPAANVGTIYFCKVTKQFTLGSNERLKSRKQIEQLFVEGKKFTLAPFRIHYIFSGPGNPTLQFGTGVSNKNFKKAIDRNRIKRLTREAWRLQKELLQKKLKDQGKRMNVFFIYTGKELPEYKTISEVMERILEKVCRITDEKK